MSQLELPFFLSPDSDSLVTSCELDFQAAAEVEIAGTRTIFSTSLSTNSQGYIQ
jgi:hypothetical protein